MTSKLLSAAHKAKMTTVENTMLSQLQKGGHRITSARRCITQVMSDAVCPLSAIEIAQEMAHRAIVVNKTTIYRELDFLIKENLVRQIAILDGTRRFEKITSHRSQHHHLVCTKCENISCVDLKNDFTVVESQILSNFGFQINQHTLDFLGLCNGCREVP